MGVYAVTCFHGRHYCVERIIKCFLDQDYDGDMTLLLYNNCNVTQVLDYDYISSCIRDNFNVKLVNNHIDMHTGKEYTNTGAIFRDAMTYVPNLSVTCFMDSDDIFLPNHISEGMRRLKEASDLNRKYIAYKPHYSYYMFGEHELELSHNNMEPSIFVRSWWVKEKGFNYLPSSYHQKWKNLLDKEERIYIPKDGTPTFIYNWVDGHHTHKISGLGDVAGNFKAHRQYEAEYGDRVLTPISDKEIKPYYNLIKNFEATNQ